MLDRNDISANQRFTSYPLSVLENLNRDGWVLKPVLPARFFRKIRIAQSGCWIWLGSRWGHPRYPEHAYGQIRVGDKRISAHVFAYEHVYGKVPSDLEVDHAVCNNKLCVNPAHLEAVTHKENCIRRSRRGSIWLASLLFILAFSSPRKVVMDDACTSPRQLSLNFNVTKEHVPTADLYNFATPVRDLPAQLNSEVQSQPVLTLEPGALPPALDELAKKYRPFIDRVLTRLSEAERKEVNTHLQQDIRQAWITVSYAQRMSDAFVQASYAIYGKHPDQIWPAIVADRKARLGAEYYDWYSSDDLLRPDVPKISPVSDTSSAALQRGKAAAGAGTPSTLAPPAPDSNKEAV